MGKCKFKCIDTQDCGLDASPGPAGLCTFHHHTNSGGAIGHPNTVRGYINENRRDYIDISHVVIRGVQFDHSFFSTDTRVVFQQTRFDNCTFQGCDFFDADFTGCTFEDCQFRNCTFRGKTCSFKVRLFAGSETPFVSCFFDLNRTEQSIVDFSGCRVLHEGHLFDRCDVSASRFFMSFADLGSSSLSLLLHDKDGCLMLKNCLGLNGVNVAMFNQMRMTGDFAYRQHQGYVSLEPEIHFRSIDFGQMRSAGFTRANLGKASFQDAVVENVLFTDPVWPISSGRKCVFDDDDSLVGDAPGLKRVMALYVRLKKNYESARNYIDAGDWFYREMECRRRLIAVNRNRVVRWLRQTFFSFPPWYRRISEYGENYSRPLWLIAGVLFAFAAAYFYWIGYPEDGGSVSYDFGVDCDLTTLGDFLDALAFSGGIMLLQFVKLAGEQPSPTPILAIVQVVLTLILVPLFLLALRRKFRR